MSVLYSKSIMLIKIKYLYFQNRGGATVKKKIVSILLIIIFIISGFGIIMYLKTDKTDEFPHYKQAYYKMNGSMYVLKDTVFNLPLTFVDSNKMSEMSSSENIKSLEIIDKNSQKLTINRWQIENKVEGSGYVFRDIQIESIMNEEGIFKPDKIVITYRDNVKKEFDFGDFDILCKSNDYVANHIAAGIICHINPIVTSKNYDKFRYAGLSLFVKGNTSNIEVKNIDLGIKGFGIDSDNLINVPLEDDLNLIHNYVEDGISKNEEWAEKVSKIQLVDSVESNIKPFTLEVPQDSNYGSNIIIPLTRLKNINMNEVQVFNVKIIFNISGEEKELIEFQPYYITPFSFDKSGIYTYLQEEGI